MCHEPCDNTLFFVFLFIIECCHGLHYRAIMGCREAQLFVCLLVQVCLHFGICAINVDVDRHFLFAAQPCVYRQRSLHYFNAEDNLQPLHQ